MGVDRDFPGRNITLQHAGAPFTENPGATNPESLADRSTAHEGLDDQLKAECNAVGFTLSV
jgi:hypothetical protein